MDRAVTISRGKLTLSDASDDGKLFADPDEVVVLRGASVTLDRGAGPCVVSITPVGSEIPYELKCPSPEEAAKWFTTIRHEIQDTDTQYMAEQRKLEERKAARSGTPAASPTPPTNRPSDSPVRERVLSIAEEQLARQTAAAAAEEQADASRSTVPPSPAKPAQARAESHSDISEMSESSGGIVRLSQLDFRGRPRLDSTTKVTQHLQQKEHGGADVSRKTVSFQPGLVSEVVEIQRSSGSGWTESRQENSLEEPRYSNRHSQQTELTESLMPADTLNQELKNSQHADDSQCARCCRKMGCVIV